MPRLTKNSKMIIALNTDLRLLEAQIRQYELSIKSCRWSINYHLAHGGKEDDEYVQEHCEDIRRYEGWVEDYKNKLQIAECKNYHEVAMAMWHNRVKKHDELMERIKNPRRSGRIRYITQRAADSVGAGNPSIWSIFRFKRQR